MTGYANGNWHNANGGRLPYRPPPTATEALPYSPFTSIIPFSPDMIPFPSTEPPTPPSTLTFDQQNAARKAVDILNNEIKDQGAVRHLNNTLHQLQDLLSPIKLPQYKFKPMPQLATPPDTPDKDKNGAAAGHVPNLSPFASMLLNQTDVSFFSPGQKLSAKPRQGPTPSRQSQPSSQSQTAPRQPPSTPNGVASARNAHLPYPSSALSSVPGSSPAPARSGPSVVVKPRQGPRDEWKFHDVDTSLSLSQQNKQADEDAAALKPHEREIADRKIEELESLVEKFARDREDPESSNHFTTVQLSDADMIVIKPKAMDNLSDKMANIINLGRFAALPVELVVDVQSLLEPGIVSTTKNDLFTVGDEEIDWSESIEAAKFALKASKMVQDTMIEGQDDYRMRREEIIDIMIDLIKFVKDACIVPVLQARRSGPSATLFTAASGQRQPLQSVLRLCGSVIGRFASLIGKYKLSDRALNTLEYLALELLMEQNSDSEKDSIFGIQKFEQFRQKSVDVLAQIFAGHAEQRNSILNGILSNLEKLPDKKASARHFKSARELPIMTISALFMRFVQVAATNRETRKTSERATELETRDEEGSAPKKRRKADPAQIAQNLSTDAHNMASHIAASLVDRASNVSKTGDKPFRNLLDLFIEDFCNVLGSPEWPAADMLLRQLVIRMRLILHGEQTAKQSVVDKDMALATLATIGCGIIDFKSRIRKLKREDLDVSQSDLSSRLDRLADEALSEDAKERINDADLLAFDGPYRMVIESLRGYMDLHSNQEDPHHQSTSGCHVTLWLAAVIQAFPDDDADSHPLVAKSVRNYLESIIMDEKWLSRKFKFQSVSTVQSQLAAGVITLQNQVCRYVPHIVSIMLGYTRDKASSKLRSRAMSSLQQLIEKDPRVLTEAHVRNMAELFSDASPMVRDSTLSLVSTCLEREPSLERHFLPRILQLTTDPSNGPKKKAIKLLKDIYGSTSRENKLKISASLLKPSQDDEKTIAELTRSALEEIWLMYSKSSMKNDDSKLKLERTQRSTLLTEVIQLIQDSTDHIEAFQKFFVWALSAEAKAPDANLRTCKELVADMIDDVISPDAGSDAKAQARIMTTLSIFAKVKAALFTIDQIQLLKLYIKEIATPEDLGLLRPTVTIFRYVFATGPSLQPSFAEEVRGGLMRNISKLANWASNGVATSRNTLIDVAHCLWTITPMADQGLLKLCTTITSIICQLKPLASCNKEQAAANRNKINSYLILLGTFGKVCDFDQNTDVFKDRLAAQADVFIKKNRATAQQLEPLLGKDISASQVLLDSVRPFTMQSWEMSIRVQALQSVGGICQQSPKLFMRGEIEKIIKLVFVNTDNEQLRRVALMELNEYFTFAERRSETGAEIAVGKGAKTGTARLETSFVANENDSATLHIAQKFLPNFVETALNNNNELAFLATNIVASISRQGLVHPKECGAALVALGTSSNDRIALIASTEHKRIHEKQESYLEKEYMQAIRIAFTYQRKVFEDPHGMREATHTPKLARLFEALKTGKKITFKKFVDNICKQIDFDLAKLKVTEDPPGQVLFARFCLENLALLDFPHLEELATCLNAVEAIVLKNTGPTVALAIETEMPKQYIPMDQPLVPDMLHQQLGDAAGMEHSFSAFIEPESTNSQLGSPPIDDTRLREIATACMILQMVWETRGFIRRCYNLHKSTGRIPQKEYAKPAQRNNFVSGKELWERLAPIMRALDTREAMLKICYDFAELLDVDREALVGEEGEENENGAGYETPTEGDEVPFPTSGRGRKRKSNVSMGNTPKKARGRPSSSKNKKRNSKTPDGDDDSD